MTRGDSPKNTTTELVYIKLLWDFIVCNLLWMRVQCYKILSVQKARSVPLLGLIYYPLPWVTRIFNNCSMGTIFSTVLARIDSCARSINSKILVRSEAMKVDKSNCMCAAHIQFDSARWTLLTANRGRVADAATVTKIGWNKLRLRLKWILP